MNQQLKHFFSRKRNWLLLSPFCSFLLFLILNLVFPFQTEIEYSPVVKDRNGVILYAFLTSDDKWRMYTAIEDISPELKTAITHKEDKYFYYHFGINPLAIARAFYNNFTSQKRTSGASTITMQVARLLQPKERTYLNKFIEMFRALQLEWSLSKDEILQLYLNLVPYGGNIEGVTAASVLYLNKSPDHLSLAEITALSIIPNRPSSLKIGANNDLIEEERNKWLKRFDEDEVFDATIIADALDESFNAIRYASPKLAPHFSFRMKAKFPNEKVINTTLDIEIQQKVAQEVTAYRERLLPLNINHATVLVIDNEMREAMAYVGSADFFDTEDGGQVDGIRAVRQPGSTLKPLVYGMAFDQGELTPQTVMTDAAVNFNGYAPINFDKEFHGYVTVEHALAQSLNIPAVKALENVGVSQVVNKMVAANFAMIEKQQDILGLSLVLGGCGVSLEELTALYAAFPNEGVYRPISYSLDENYDTTSLQIVSPESSFMLSEILTQLERPDLPFSWRNAKNRPLIAWKTGTSYGRKDAWSIGYNDKYTVGVWVGNFSGHGVPELTGASQATPLLFKIFNAIDPNASQNWLKAPTDLKFRLVCSETGLLPSENCEHKIFDYYLPLISSNQICNHLQKVYVAANDSFSYCHTCLPETGYKETYLHNHPPEILSYYQFYHINYEAMPPHNPACEKIYTQGAPQVTIPIDGATYYINENEPEEMSLQGQLGNDAQTTFWYINDAFEGEVAKNGSLFFMPPEGKVKISCSDDLGRNTDIFIEVEYVRF